MKILPIIFASTLAKKVADGKCPFKPGEIRTFQAKNLDYVKIQGYWIHYYDEKELLD